VCRGARLRTSVWETYRHPSSARTVPAERSIMKHSRLALAFLIASAVTPTCVRADNAGDGAIGTRIAVEVKQLDYTEDVGRALAELAAGWQTEGGAPLTQQWAAALAEARRKHDDGALSDEKLAEVETRVIGELAATLTKEFRLRRRTGALTLDVMIAKKTAQSITYAQMVYVVGRALGLRLDPLAVTYPIVDEQPVLCGHYACLAELADETTLMVDASCAPAVSAPFYFETTYHPRDGGFYVLLDGAEAAGLHRRVRVLDHDGLRAAVYLGRAEAEFNRGHWRKAREQAEQAIELDGGSAVAYRTRAVLRVIRGEYDEALDDARKALALDAESAEAWNAIGNVRRLQENAAEAFEASAKAIEMNPAYAAPHLNRADALLIEGKRDEAEAEAAKTVELAPRDALVRCAWAEFCAELGKQDKAVEGYTAAIELDPDFAPAYAKRAAILAGLGKREEALADCAKAIALDPDDAITRTAVGFALDQAGEHGEALEQFSKAVKLDPELAMAHYWRAHALGRRGDSRLIQIGVLRGLAKAIELDPRFAAAYIARGDFYVKHNDPDKGLEDLNTAIELEPRNDWAHACRAGAHVALGDYESAIVDLDRAIEITPTYTYCYYKRGICHAELGYDEEAVQDWRKALELDPQMARWVRRAADEYGLDIEEED
jgi:tetratricopeptide (TPR) repeat protein